MKINLAVIYGGKSTEHEISVISALQAMENLDADKYAIIPIYITKDNCMYTGDALKDIGTYKDPSLLRRQCERIYFEAAADGAYVKGTQKQLFGRQFVQAVDVALPIVHGTNAEDGTIAGFLRLHNLPFVSCDVLAAAVGMDKPVQKVLLQSAGIPVLPCGVYTLADMEDFDRIRSEVKSRFDYPVVVKPANLGSSIGISVADDEAVLKTGMELALSFAGRVLVERAVPNLKEINCSVLGDETEAQASECEEPVTAHAVLSYADKYLGNGKGNVPEASKGMAGLGRKIPADISEQERSAIRKTAVEAFAALGCSGVVRIDFLMDAQTREYWLNEVNTIPGSLAFYLWEPLGMAYRELLDSLVAIALKRARREKGITYSFDTDVLSHRPVGIKK